MKIKIAAFLDTVDPLFHLNTFGDNYYGIVGKNTLFYDFVKNNFPKNKLLPISINNTQGKPLSEREILYSKELLDGFKKIRISHLIVPYRCTKVMKDWAKENNIILLGPPYYLQHKLENKLYFDKLLKKHSLSSPNTITNIEDIKKRKSTSYVVQSPTSWGLEGTTFYKDIKGVTEKINKTKNKLLVREYKTGTPIGVSICIDGSGNYFFSSFRTQCYLKNDNLPYFFLGIQWLPTNFFNKTTTSNIYELLEKLAKVLYVKKFIGVANIDLIISDNIPYILECNPRASAATAQFFSAQHVSPLQDPYTFYINSFLRIKNEKPSTNSIKSSYEGSILEICVTSQWKVKKIPPVGIYRVFKNKLQFEGSDLSLLHRENSFLLLHELHKTGIYKKNEQICLIIADKPLFLLSQGTLNKNGKQVYELCKDEFLNN